MEAKPNGQPELGALELEEAETAKLVVDTAADTEVGIVADKVAGKIVDTEADTEDNIEVAAGTFEDAEHKSKMHNQDQKLFVEQRQEQDKRYEQLGPERAVDLTIPEMKHPFVEVSAIHPYRWGQALVTAERIQRVKIRAERKQKLQNQFLDE